MVVNLLGIEKRGIPHAKLLACAILASDKLTQSSDLPEVINDYILSTDEVALGERQGSDREVAIRREGQILNATLIEQHLPRTFQEFVQTLEGMFKEGYESFLRKPLGEDEDMLFFDPENDTSYHVRETRKELKPGFGSDRLVALKLLVEGEGKTNSFGMVAKSCTAPEMALREQLIYGLIPEISELAELGVRPIPFYGRLGREVCMGLAPGENLETVLNDPSLSEDLKEQLKQKVLCATQLIERRTKQYLANQLVDDAQLGNEDARQLKDRLEQAVYEFEIAKQSDLISPEARAMIPELSAKAKKRIAELSTVRIGKTIQPGDTYFEEKARGGRQVCNLGESHKDALVELERRGLLKTHLDDPRYANWNYDVSTDTLYPIDFGLIDIGSEYSHLGRLHDLSGNRAKREEVLAGLASAEDARLSIYFGGLKALRDHEDRGKKGFYWTRLPICHADVCKLAENNAVWHGLKQDFEKHYGEDLRSLKQDSKSRATA
ncbi:hypothetical protein HN592_02795 [Candidatus Woesearchaeota archaeon]|jgi:hypothetical protein|nr:hypothetical protein [Candidatus Woesearchaeota archaeon]MBT4368140.1 hypothetical protein [Candidatus Woesearchaeota archaeon]MBT4712628.1 hypothetical protein [Candidatus Woesearchaeota archaeon]MBT6639541.1 hypothetical protein [Candidatus Woesearchaeota archaeon]MBT7133713.1 hypothetical protein [Candidatus Woesearchaeota archaeon]